MIYIPRICPLGLGPGSAENPSEVVQKEIPDLDVLGGKLMLVASAETTIIDGIYPCAARRMLSQFAKDRIGKARACSGCNRRIIVDRSP